MPHSTKTKLLGLLKPVGFAPRGAAAQSAADAPQACERLERIAMYARAGYFNMGYTLDMMQAPGEILPD
ncbi:hypothetical protein [Paraburkholderia sp. 2C]